MRSINWLLAGCVLGIGIEAAPAQQATPEQINKALELLRSMPPLTNAATGAVSTVTVPAGQIKAPAPAVTDPKALREAAQKAEAAARQQANRETKQLRNDKLPANANSLAEEQELRAKAEAERQKEISRIEAEVEKVRQTRGQSTNAPGLSPNIEKQARELLNQVLETTKDAKVPTTLVPTITTGTTPKSTKAEAGLPAITVAPAPATPVTPVAPVASQPAKPAPVAAPKPISTPVTIPGALTPEQERKARELLERALSQAPAQPAAVKTAPPVAPPAPKAPTPAVVVTPPAAPAVVTAPAVKVTPPTGLTPEQERKALDLLEKKMRQETENRQAVQAPTAPVGTPPAAVTAPVVATPPATVPTPAPAKIEFKTKEEIKAETKRLEKEQREAELRIKAEAKKKAEAEETARKTLDRLEAESKAKAKEQAGQRLGAGDKPSKEAKVKAEPASVSAPAAKATAKPVEVKTKQQRLAELLESYMKDKLTPEQYHTQRAKLLAEP